MKKRRRVDISLHPKSHLNGILQRQVKDKPAQALKRGVDSALRSMGHAASIPVKKGGRAIRNGLANTRSRFVGDDEAMQQEDLQYYKPQLNIVGLDDAQIETADDASGIRNGNSKRKENKHQTNKSTKNFPWQTKLTGGQSGSASFSESDKQPQSADRNRRIPALRVVKRQSVSVASDAMAMPMQGILEPAGMPRAKGTQAGEGKTVSRQTVSSKARAANRKRLGILAILVSTAAFLVFGWYMLFGRYCVVNVYDDGVLKAVRTKDATVEQMLQSASYTLTPEDILSVPKTQKPRQDMVVTITRARDISISADGQTSSVRLANGTIADAIAMAGITVSADDEVVPALQTPIVSNASVEVLRAKTVYINTKSKKIKVLIASGTVSDVLTKAGLSFDKQDQVSPSLSSGISDGLTISFMSIDIKTVAHKETIAYETVKKNSTAYFYGTTKVSQSGKNGEKTITEEVTYRDDVVVSRKTISSKITKKPVDKILLVGCKPTLNPAIAGLPKGGPTQSMIDHTVVMAQITAYTHSGHRTATGKWPKVGMCAIDRRVFTYGTLFYVPGYGYAVAEDTGSGVGDPYSMDVFMDTQTQCSVWGRKRNVTVYVLKR